MTEHIVAGEHCILFFQYESHVIRCVAGAVESAQSCSFGTKYLTILDVELACGWMMLVNGCVFAKGEEISNSSDMIRVPMGKENLRNGSSLGGEDRIKLS